MSEFCSEMSEGRPERSKKISRISILLVGAAGRKDRIVQVRISHKSAGSRTI